jgi:hypothetical protein
MRRRLGATKPTPRKPLSRFTPDLLRKTLDDLQGGKLGKTDRVTFGDDEQPGLRAIVRKSGTVSFHVIYSVNGERPILLVGHWPDTGIDEARSLAKTIRALAAEGIDVTEGLHARLISELKRDGTAWRPT